MSMRIPVLLSVLLSVSAFPHAGEAYSVDIHAAMPNALADVPGISAEAPLPDDARLERFRTEAYTYLAATTDAELRRRFLARWPTPEHFDATAFKVFFGTAVTQAALGFDPYGRVAAQVDARSPLSRVEPDVARPLLHWVRVGSVYPDLDRRNQDRWWHTESGAVAVREDGVRIPWDPVILNMGEVEGLSGQAHAHYGLNDHPKSASPLTLLTRPADFAVPVGFDGPVLTFAPERAQAYGDLAVVANHLGEPALAALYAGNAFHYLGDLGNQIHTFQVGIPAFFLDAVLEYVKESLRCVFGLRCEVRSFKAIGLDIMTNHHTWTEEYFRLVLRGAEAGQPVHPVLADSGSPWSVDEAELATWRPVLWGEMPMRALAGRLIDMGNEEGPAIYRHARGITRGDLRRAGVRIEFDQVSDAAVLDALNPEARPEDVRAMVAVQRAGLTHALAAMRVWWEAHLAPDARPDPRQAADRLLRLQLDEMDAAEARRERFSRP